MTSFWGGLNFYFQVGLFLPKSGSLVLGPEPEISFYINKCLFQADDEANLYHGRWLEITMYTHPLKTWLLEVLNGMLY